MWNTALGEKAGQTAPQHTIKKQQSEELKWHTVGRLLAAFTDSKRHKGTGRYHILPPPLSISTRPAAVTSTVLTLPNVLHHILHHYALVEPLFPVMLASVPACRPTPQDNQPKSLPTPHLLPWEFCGALVPVAVMTGLISQADQSFT